MVDPTSITLTVVGAQLHGDQCAAGFIWTRAVKTDFLFPRIRSRLPTAIKAWSNCSTVLCAGLQSSDVTSTCAQSHSTGV